MLVNNKNSKGNAVEFISYTGKYPNLCSGDLTLKINGKIYKFDYNTQFWRSGGCCGFTNDYENSYIEQEDWVIDVESLPEQLKCYASEIDEVFNSNVPCGCCGGCL